MSAIDTLYAALFGNPPSIGFKPSREGVLKAFIELGINFDASLNGFESYETVSAMNADTSQPSGTIAYVYRNGGSATDASNGFYQRVGSAWETAGWLTNIVAQAAISAGFSGPFSQRPFPGPRDGFVYYATDLGRSFIWLKAGSANPMPPFGTVFVDTYVGLYTFAELNNLGIDKTDRLAQTKVAGTLFYESLFDDLAKIDTGAIAVRIADFALALCRVDHHLPLRSIGMRTVLLTVSTSHGV